MNPRYILLCTLKVQNTPKGNLPLVRKSEQLDLLGILCFLPSNISLILTLKWGGLTYFWNDRRIIALLTVFGILLVSFIAIRLRTKTATIPPRIIRQPSIAFGSLYSICAARFMIVFIYYLPIWFQVIKSFTAVESGIVTLPTSISLTIRSTISGIVTIRIGYYTPAMILAVVFTSVGAGLITTFEVNTDHAKWISYQFIYGFGLGLGMKAPKPCGSDSPQRRRHAGWRIYSPFFRSNWAELCSLPLVKYLCWPAFL